MERPAGWMQLRQLVQPSLHKFTVLLQRQVRTARRYRLERHFFCRARVQTLTTCPRPIHGAAHHTGWQQPFLKVPLSSQRDPLAFRCEEGEGDGSIHASPYMPISPMQVRRGRLHSIGVREALRKWGRR